MFWWRSAKKNEEQLRERKNLQDILLKSVADSSFRNHSKSNECFEQKYRRLLLHYFTVALHRNISAHNISAEKILGSVGKWRTLNSISAVVLFVATTSGTLRENIRKIDLRSVSPNWAGWAVDWMFPLEPELVFLAVGLFFLSTSLFQNLGRFEDGYFAHKTAAGSFSELRREMLEAMGAKVLGSDVMRRFREQYQVIVDNSPMAHRKAWKKAELSAEDTLNAILAMIYEFAHRADNESEEGPPSARSQSGNGDWHNQEFGEPDNSEVGDGE